MDNPGPTILQVMQDKRLLGGEFSGRSWKAWRTFLAAVYGHRIHGKALELYRESTGREKPPTRQCREVFCVAGRRAGKSMISALIAVYTAAFRNYTAVLSTGEVAVCMVIAADKAQARVVMGYLKGLLQSSQMLSKLVIKYRAEAVELRGRVRIEVHASSFRSVRGYSVACVIMDELSFWRSDESANPDFEVARAIRPALATIPGAMLVGISSPYSRRGLLWREYSNHWAQDSDTLIWRAPTLSMNPTIDRAVIDKAFESDAVAADSEWNAEFRSDLETYISLEAVESVTELGRLELPRLRGVQYSSFCDPSGGAAGGDEFTLAVGHLEREGVAVLDLVRSRRGPFDPSAVTEEYAADLKRYGISQIRGDRYSAMWVREAFRKHGVEYKLSDLSKSDIYRELLPMINSRKVELLDIPKLKTQLVALERRTGRGGKDSVDHAPGGHDELANSAAGCLVALGGRSSQVAGLSLGLNDDFIQAGEFGDAAWSYTAGEPEGVKGADDAEIMRRRQRDQL